MDHFNSTDVNVPGTRQLLGAYYAVMTEWNIANVDIAVFYA